MRYRVAMTICVACITISIVLTAILLWRRMHRPMLTAPNIIQSFDYRDDPSQVLEVKAGQEAAQSKCAHIPKANRMVIPSVCIDAELNSVSVSDGQLNIPSDITSVGIWQPKQFPNTTVIAGHVDDARQGQGVLYHLHELLPGAESS